MATVWTQGIALDWRPELRFYETRIAILRELDERKVLRAFRVGDDAVDARLFREDGVHQLSMRAGGVTLYLLDADADADAAWESTKLAVEQIAPLQPRSVTVGFQMLAPLGSSFDAAVSKARSSIMRPWRSESLALVDFALLTDVQLPSQSATGQFEFGILSSQEEAVFRLRSGIGRLTFSLPPRPMTPDFLDKSYPDVAVFLEGALTRPLQSPEILDEAWTFWHEARREVANVVDELQLTLSSDDDGGDGP